MPATFLQKLQETIDLGLSFSDIRSALSDCLNDLFPGQYAYICDIYGDSESGDVVYYQGGDTYRAPYEIGQANGKRVHVIHTDQAQDVLPRTVYDEEADEGDQMAGMSEAQRAEKFVERFPGSGEWKHRPFSERFISKDERDAADSGSFAGKNKSFPILKPGDVMAAVRSMGRAGADNYGVDTLKKNIIRIAKKKGWTKYLPKSWQAGSDDKPTEGAKEAASEVLLIGDTVDLKEGAVGMDGTTHLKLIAPGWGSSGYYSADVLKRDGPKVFKAGTQNFWDHQTDQEEAERPEGSLRDLASVLTEDARWEEAGPAGPGLYAKAKVMENFRQVVDDLAPHIGVSIRAAGITKEGKAEGRTGAIVERITRAKSADYVTKAGAGGKVLQLFEAARGGQFPTRQQEASDMDQAAIEKAIKEAQAPLLAELKALREKQSAADAGTYVDTVLEGLRIPAKLKTEIKRRVITNAIATGGDALTQPKLKEATDATAKELCDLVEAVAPTGRPLNLGAAASAVKPEEQAKQFTEAYEAEMDDLAEMFMGEGKTNKKARKAFKEGRAA